MARDVSAIQSIKPHHWMLNALGATSRWALVAVLSFAEKGGIILTMV